MTHICMPPPPHQHPPHTQGRPARIVNVSSKLQELGHIHIDDPHLTSQGAYTPAIAYGQSKLAQVLFAVEMQARIHARAAQHNTPVPVVCFALHPGEVLTNVSRALPAWVRGAQKVIMPLFLLTPSQGARCTVYCATSDRAAEVVLARGQVYFDSNCQPRRPNKQAEDGGLRKWLWAFSEMGVGVPQGLRL